MTVKEYAKQHGVSNQAVYTRLKRIRAKSNKPLTAYIDEKTSELTPEGTEALNLLYDSNQTVLQVIDNQSNDKIKRLTNRVDDLISEVDRLTNQVVQLTDEKEKLEKQIADAQRDHDALVREHELILSAKNTKIEALESMNAELKRDKDFSREAEARLIVALQQAKQPFFKRLFGKKQHDAVVANEEKTP